MFLNSKKLQNRIYFVNFVRIMKNIKIPFNFTLQSRRVKSILFLRSDAAIINVKTYNWFQLNPKLFYNATF